MKECTLKDFSAFKACIILLGVALTLSALGAISEIGENGITSPEGLAKIISERIIELVVKGLFICLSVYLTKAFLKITGGIKLSYTIEEQAR